jgi:hypothetical protein
MTVLLSMRKSVLAMTFKDLRKIVATSNNQQQQQTTLFSSRVCDKPFWIWNIEEHKVADIIMNGDCCFNHIIGLPKKNTQDKPFFDYEKLLFDALQQQKHVWIKKATGLGITEFMLRYMVWLCLRNNNLQGTQMCIVTGPRIDLAITLIDRMKKLFTDNGLVTFDRNSYRVKWSTHRGISLTSLRCDERIIAILK